MVLSPLFHPFGGSKIFPPNMRLCLCRLRLFFKFGLVVAHAVGTAADFFKDVPSLVAFPFFLPSVCRFTLFPPAPDPPPKLCSTFPPFPPLVRCVRNSCCVLFGHQTDPAQVWCQRISGPSPRWSFHPLFFLRFLFLWFEIPLDVRNSGPPFCPRAL